MTINGRLSGINPDEVYVLHQPKHILMSIVVIGKGTGIPLTEEIQGNLDTLSGMSDVFYVFPENGITKKDEYIDPRAFTSLHSGCGFISCSKLPMIGAILKALHYSTEIFGKHLGYSLTQAEWLVGIGERMFQNLVEINGSAMMKPVLEITRLGPKVLSQFYIKREAEDTFRLPWEKKDNYKYPSEWSGMYCKFTSPSKILFLRNSIVQLILSRYGDIDFVKFYSTFVDIPPYSWDMRYFIASLLKDMGIDNINNSIEDLEIGKL